MAKPGSLLKKEPPLYENISKSAENLALVEWCASFHEEREPKTQKELAKKLGLHEVTLSWWKTMPKFQEDVTALMMSKMKEASQDSLWAWVKRLRKESSAADIKLLLQWLHDWQENVKTKVESEDLREIAAALRDIAGVPAAPAAPKP